ncbi:MAG: hypothetical protein FD144_2659 [Rhodospirillaceae bacterium]|nr:MAG: hypothetical protein FD144_2659 [Rhodospirillaceae bacterium]
MAGRPAFKPTRDQRSDVEIMKADGWSNERIALQLRISRPTLEKAFANELQYGRDTVQLENLKSLRKMAKKNASANRQLNDRLDLAATRRPDGGDEPPAPTKETKLGKKELQQIAAETPDTSTEMGELLAKRMSLN